MTLRGWMMDAFVGWMWLGDGCGWSQMQLVREEKEKLLIAQTKVAQANSLCRERGLTRHYVLEGGKRSVFSWSFVCCVPRSALSPLIMYSSQPCPFSTISCLITSLFDCLIV